MSNPFDDLKDDGDEIVDDTPTTEETAADRDEADQGETDQDEAGATAENDTREAASAASATSTVSESTDSGSSTATTQSSRSAADSTSTSPSTSTSTSTPDPSRDREPEPDTGADADGSDPAETGPAFEYSAVRQKPLYARDETWNDLEDELGITVTPELRRMGIRDEETREIHDAILKVAIEHIDEISDVIADQRRESA